MTDTAVGVFDASLVLKSPVSLHKINHQSSVYSEAGLAEAVDRPGACSGTAAKCLLAAPVMCTYHCKALACAFHLQQLLAMFHLTRFNVYAGNALSKSCE